MTYFREVEKKFFWGRGGFSLTHDNNNAVIRIYCTAVTYMDGRGKVHAPVPYVLACLLACLLYPTVLYLL